MLTCWVHHRTFAVAPAEHAARLVAHFPTVHRLLRRAVRLFKALPDELLYIFEKKTAGLRQSMEAERLVARRVRQDIFRTTHPTPDQKDEGAS